MVLKMFSYLISLTGLLQELADQPHLDVIAWRESNRDRHHSPRFQAAAPW